MKRILWACLLVLVVSGAGAQVQPARNYAFISSGNIVADKNFYLLTVITKYSHIASLITQCDELKHIYDQKYKELKAHATDTCTIPGLLLSSFRFTTEDSVTINLALSKLYETHRQEFDKMLNNNIRPSGCYQLFAKDNNKTLLLKSWNLCAKGINYIMDQFGLGQKMRYPNLDSMSYSIYSPTFLTALKSMFAVLSEKKTDAMFYSPSLMIGMQLMDINERDEPARFEPLSKGENLAAYTQVAKTDFAKYKYAALLVLGQSPDNYSVKISPLGKLRCDIVAEHYRNGEAPFIITTGGFCAPFRTQYCEALEMKHYLMKKHNIPEEAIIIDPYARHTTTNFRNANRLIFYYGLPMNKQVMAITTKDHNDYILDESKRYGNFSERCVKELGYLPLYKKERDGMHATIYYPDTISLHRDPTDPLDP